MSFTNKCQTAQKHTFTMNFKTFTNSLLSDPSNSLTKENIKILLYLKYSSNLIVDINSLAFLFCILCFMLYSYPILCSQYISIKRTVIRVAHTNQNIWQLRGNIGSKGKKKQYQQKKEWNRSLNRMPPFRHLLFYSIHIFRQTHPLQNVVQSFFFH